MRLAILSVLLAIRCFATYNYCIPVTTDPSKAGGSNISNYLIWICANGSTPPCDAGTHTELVVTYFKNLANGGAVTDANGYDIRPFSDSGCSSALTYWLEKFKTGTTSYNGTTGYFSMFVQMGTLSASVANTFYLGVGNASVTTDGSSASAYTADANMLRVFNLSAINNDIAAGIGENTGLGSSYVWGGTSTRATTLLASADDQNAAGASGKLESVPGTESGLPSTSSNQAITFSVWFKSTNTGNAWVFATGCAGGCGFNEVGIATNSGDCGTANKACFRASNPGYTGAVSTTSVNDGNWHYLVASYNGTNQSHFYVDGVLEATQSTGSATYTGQNGISIGDVPGDAGSSALCQCQLDEARLRSDYISDGRVAADYNNQSSPWTFYAFGAPVSSKVSHKVISQ